MIRPRPVGLALVALATANLLAHRVAPRAGPAIAVAKVAALAWTARRAGLGRSDLGVTGWRSGLRWGTGAAVAVAFGYGVVLGVPAARAAIAGSGRSLATAGRRSLVDIQLVTVLPEEFAFRGVVLALLGGDRRAAIGSSVLFGAWHVLPALGGGAANETVGDVVGGVLGGGARGEVLRVSGTVLVTTVGGLAMAQLRLLSGSLLAPVLLHWAVNGLGELVAASGPCRSVGHRHHQDRDQRHHDQDPADPQR